MVTAAGGGLSDLVPTRITQLLSHWNSCSDLVCVQLSVSDNQGKEISYTVTEIHHRLPPSPVCQVCSFVLSVLLHFLVYGCWAASLCLVLASSLSILV